MLPKDPNVLLSVINTKLRDKYQNINDLCDDLDESKDEIDNILNKIGYFYSLEQNRYINYNK